MWICSDCGKEKGEEPRHDPTWHFGICDWCKRIAAVTEPRDFRIKDKNNDNRND